METLLFGTELSREDVVLLFYVILAGLSAIAIIGAVCALAAEKAKARQNSVAGMYLHALIYKCCSSLAEEAKEHGKTKRSGA